MNNKVPSFEDLQSASSEQIEQVAIPERHFGNTVPLSMRPDGQPKYVLGPHYLVFLCSLIITSIFGIAMAYNVISTTKGRQTEITIALIVALLNYIYSYTSVGLSNPGIASTIQEPTEEMKTDHRYCVPCKIVRPMRTIHCYQCDVCITGYDHHCPWVGKCVGRGNMCHFQCFLFSVMVIFVALGACMFVASLYEPVRPVHPIQTKPSV